MNWQGELVCKRFVSKVDSFFLRAQVEESDKLDFNTAYTNIKRELDQKLHTYKELIDLQSNRRVAEAHHSVTDHLEARLVKEVSSMRLMTRMFFLKLI